MTDADMSWVDDLEEETPIPPDDKIKMLANLASHYASLEKSIDEAEEKLAVLCEHFRVLREDIIPDRMMEFGVKKIVLDDGSTLSYSNFYAGKVLKEEGYDWLEENGYPDAVKQTLTLEVSRIDKRLLEIIKEWIGDEKNFDNLSIKEKQTVHHMTLGSVIKGLTKDGQQLPPDLIETYIGNRATLKKGTASE